jgi:hypothetical protein
MKSLVTRILFVSKYSLEFGNKSRLKDLLFSKVADHLNMSPVTAKLPRP